MPSPSHFILTGNADLREHLEARFGPNAATADERSKLAVDVSVCGLARWLPVACVGAGATPG